MAIHQEQLQSSEHRPLIADLPSRVIVALERLTCEEQESVLKAVQAFARDEIDGQCLSAQDSLYILDAAPEVRVIVRREPHAPVDVVDIVRPATLQALANAR